MFVRFKILKIVNFGESRRMWKTKTRVSGQWAKDVAKASVHTVPRTDKSCNQKMYWMPSILKSQF